MSVLYGNAVVGQSGGPTAAINATLAGVIRGYLDKDSHGGAIGTLYGMRNGVEELGKIQYKQQVQDNTYGLEQ